MVMYATVGLPLSRSSQSTDNFESISSLIERIPDCPSMHRTERKKYSPLKFILYLSACHRMQCSLTHRASQSQGNAMAGGQAPLPCSPLIISALLSYYFNLWVVLFLGGQGTQGFPSLASASSQGPPNAIDNRAVSSPGADLTGPLSKAIRVRLRWIKVETSFFSCHYHSYYVHHKSTLCHPNFTPSDALISSHLTCDLSPIIPPLFSILHFAIHSSTRQHSIARFPGVHPHHPRRSTISRTFLTRTIDLQANPPLPRFPTANHASTISCSDFTSCDLPLSMWATGGETCCSPGAGLETSSVF